MPFGHKLAHRLALLKGRLHRGALLALALSFVASCEKPISITGTNSTVTQLVVSPATATLQPNQVQDFMAVGFTAGGDTAGIAVSWNASSGTVDTNSAGGRHYGHYHNASCGQFTLTATSKPGNLSGSANIAVTCGVATVTISPATAVATSVVRRAFTKWPMMRRWLVSQMSGTMANGSWIDSETCDRISTQ